LKSFVFSISTGENLNYHTPLSFWSAKRKTLRCMGHLLIHWSTGFVD
jgi:hypothetical protein